MKFVGVIIFVFSMFTAADFTGRYDCLPADIKEDSVVGFTTVASSKGSQTTHPVTVRETLRKMKARCSCGKLVAGRGKPIRFYQLQGCWGNPPADYLEILDQQKKEIEKLKKTYTVIEMTCNPGGLPPQSIL